MNRAAASSSVTERLQHVVTVLDRHGQRHLVDRRPSVSPERLIAQLVPPPAFAGVSFDSYHPDPGEPSQTAALAACRQFGDTAMQRRAGKKRLFGKRSVLPGVGLYLDGGFGVGKTHLLASLYFASARRSFASQGIRDLRRADTARRGVRVRRVHRPAGRLRDRLHRRVRARRPGKHRAGVAACCRSWSRAACPWRRRRTHCPSSSARAGSPQKTSYAKSILWQVFSRRCGLMVRTTGTAICRPRPCRFRTRRRGRAPRRPPGATIDDFDASV